MLGNRNNHGAKRRFLVCNYFICFLLSLAPSIVAPPEKGFSQGQPEMHQAMDNMVSHGVLLKKTGPTYPPSAVNYPALFTSKTNNLLDEAENALSTMHNSKEKQWVETFVQRMRSMAIMLQDITESSNQHLSKNMNSVSGTPVPEGLPSQPEPSAVRASNPFQKPSKMMSKFPVTSPELSQVLPDSEYTSERQVVTKPAMMSNKPGEEEEDELVRELESLHQEVAVVLPVQSSKVIAPTTDFTSPVTPAYPKNVVNQKMSVDNRKEELKAKLLKQISEYERMGGDFPQKLIAALKGDDRITSSLAQNENTESSTSGVKNGGMFDNFGEEQPVYVKKEEKRMPESNSEHLVSDKNKEPPSEDQQTKNGNSTYQTSHLRPNLPTFPKLNNEFPHISSLSKSQPYHRGHGHAMGNFQKPNPYNFRGNYRVKYQQNHISEALKRKMRLENRMYNGHLAASHYNEYMAKSRYRPHGYSQHMNHINSTLNFEPEMSPYKIKPMVNHQIETQLNDEMKRQLRDGKIVVLSDSVVKSNFDTNAEENMKANERNKVKQDMNDQKNNTQTMN